MTNLEKLESDIRQKLPRLMELTEGCKIIFQDKSKTIIALDPEPNIYVLVQSENKTNGWYSQEFIRDKSTVIGHDPKLNDVLEWLGIEYMINGKGTICKWSDDEYRYIPQDNWNLSEPLLKNQDQSVINYLAGLI